MESETVILYCPPSLSLSIYLIPPTASNLRTVFRVSRPISDSFLIPQIWRLKFCLNVFLLQVLFLFPISPFFRCFNSFHSIRVRTYIHMCICFLCLYFAMYVYTQLFTNEYKRLCSVGFVRAFGVLLLRFWFLQIFSEFFFWVWILVSIFSIMCVVFISFCWSKYWLLSRAFLICVWFVGLVKILQQAFVSCCFWSIYLRE